MVMLISKGEVSDVEKLHMKWIAQRKYDGVLAVAICVDGYTKILGRNGTDLTKRFPKIAEEMSRFNGSYMGEIICDTFKHTCSRAKTENTLKSNLLVDEYPAKFMVFDKIVDKIYFERVKEVNEDFLQNTQTLEQFKFIEIVESFGDAIGLWERAKKENWEGIILKNPQGLYEDKRTKSQLKVKCVKSKDISFVRFEENNAGVKCFSDDDFHKVQVSGSQSVAVKENIENTGSCMIEVEYLEEFETGKLRMPVCKEVKSDNKL